MLSTLGRCLFLQLHSSPASPPPPPAPVPAPPAPPAQTEFTTLNINQNFKKRKQFFRHPRACVKFSGFNLSVDFNLSGVGEFRILIKLPIRPIIADISFFDLTQEGHCGSLCSQWKSLRQSGADCSAPCPHHSAHYRLGAHMRVGSCFFLRWSVAFFSTCPCLFSPRNTSLRLCWPLLPMSPSSPPLFPPPLLHRHLCRRPSCIDVLASITLLLADAFYIVPFASSNATAAADRFPC